MKRLLTLLLLAGCASNSQPAHFRILQLNDVYKIEGLEKGESGGLARVRTLRKQLEADGSAVLVLHGGDALYPSVMSKYLEAKPMVEILNLLDGDARAFDPALIVTFGNHELDNKTPDVLLARLRDSQFQWLATNTQRCDPECNGRFPATEELIVMDIGRTRVGLFGLLYPIKKSYAQSTDVVAAAKESVRRLRGRGANVIIALTHEDMPDDVALVKQVSGIDFVIGGHDHLYMQDQVNGTWITKADADAKSVIVYDVTVPWRGRAQATPQRVMLDQTIARDPQVQGRVNEWQKTLAEKLGGEATLGTTTHLLEGVEPAIRGRETALGNLLADAAREQMGTDLAIINGGSIRINDNIPPGPITTTDMEGIFYYTNTLVAFRATGAQLLDLLRNAVSRADAGDGRFLQVSGLRYTYHPRNGQFLVDAGDVEVNGKPLDVNATYSIATLDYVYLHGTEDNFLLFSDANRPPKVNIEREADFRTTIEQYIRDRGTITTAIEGRIVRAEGS
ncbi:MAG: bifunctional metallophosphatase/5'-nucleotidase [Acidobacteriota bacterium]|nr:bifunctional metallophosphatase/5'-nucleotidase [Acidobacteriota bacterium]